MQSIGADVAEQAKAMYENGIRQKVADGNKGKFLIVDVTTGDYEMDANEVTAAERAFAKNPNGQRFMFRIGYTTAHAFGHPLEEEVR